ncbi:hypothetical protein SASPL_135315 [Salvia splendens]|uniref:Aminotransferase-like plant mobile domain-containing protein n=1 Tax=Salvia splendens TaxID=180675 RepID=A0A8X8WZW3_SALSN|nr:hypothetical protein SASPL_135315 [Salvia splendens]
MIDEKKQKKSVEDEKQSEIAENVSQRLPVKRKPLYFVDAISQLNEAQINSVKELGFESVLHYRIEYIPSRLAFSLLKSFDEEKCKIKLYNGKKIHITEDDVELVYGFPRGDITYCREKWKSNAPLMRELAEQCDTKPGNVNHKAVEQLMLADQKGGPQFKILFLVLLESALIEPSTCGMIKSKIGEIIDDLDNVRNINWCSYTIYVLKFAMGNWSKTEKNAFAGPLPFFMAAYYHKHVVSPASAAGAPSGSRVPVGNMFGLQERAERREQRVKKVMDLSCGDHRNPIQMQLKVEEEGDGGGGRAAEKKQASKDWESMSLSEKAVELYVGEK